MNNKNIINVLKFCILPPLVLFTYLFYLFWSAPLDYILQEYTIDNYFIFKNSYLHYSIGASVLFTILLFVFYKTNLKIAYNITAGFILSLIVMMSLYPVVFPYNLGMFLDNIALIPENSPLGFSKIYYLLDVIIVVFSLLLAIISIRKKFFIPICTLILVFYSFQNISTMIKASGNIVSLEKQIVFSKNHNNVICLMFDGMEPRITEYFLTNNSMPKELINWSDDFTFYENVTSLSAAHTSGSMPNVYMGFERPPQDVFYKLYTGVAEPLSLGYYEYKPRVDFFESIKDFAHGVDVASDNFPRSSPIIFVKLYQSMPYFFRNTLANEYGWTSRDRTWWISVIESNRADEFSVEDTEQGHVYMILSQITHSPWSSTGTNLKMSSYLTLEEAEIVFYYNIKDAFTYISKVINKLKEEGIYDSSKIIIASDHGIHLDSVHVKPFLQKVRGKNYSTNIYDIQTTAIRRHGVNYSMSDALHITYLPSTLMVKDIDTTNDKMTVDDRFLALADMRGIIESTFGITNIADYTRTMPPKRVFNIPMINSHFTQRIYNRSRRANTIRELEDIGYIEFIKLESLYPEFTITDIFTVPLDEMADVPIVEIIE